MANIEKLRFLAIAHLNSSMSAIGQVSQSLPDKESASVVSSPRWQITKVLKMFVQTRP